MHSLEENVTTSPPANPPDLRKNLDTGKCRFCAGARARHKPCAARATSKGVCSLCRYSIGFWPRLKFNFRKRLPRLSVTESWQSGSHCVSFHVHTKGLELIQMALSEHCRVCIDHNLASCGTVHPQGHPTQNLTLGFIQGESSSAGPVDSPQEMPKFPWPVVFALNAPVHAECVQNVLVDSIDRTTLKFLSHILTAILHENETSVIHLSE